MSARFTRILMMSPALALLVLTAASAGAQPGPSGPAGSPSYAAPSQPAGVTTMEGKVERWLPNPDGEIDALLLDDGSLVRFPSHLDDQLVAVARRGDRVAATGRQEVSGRDLKAEAIGPSPGQLQSVYR